MSTSSSSSVSNVARTNDTFELSEEARADDQYVVEKIIAKRRNRKGKWEYLLKWAGFSDEDNTWEQPNDIHPDLIAEFERHHGEADAVDPIYTSLGDDLPIKTQNPSKSSIRLETPPTKKKKKTSTSSTNNSLSATPTEPKKKLYGVEKGWRVRAVIGAAKQKDSSVIYAVDYVQGSPLLREYVPSEVAHVYIPRELIEFFQKKIVWNSSSDPKKA